MKIKPLSPTFEMPQYQTEGAACFDLQAYFDTDEPIQVRRKLTTQEITEIKPLILDPGSWALVPLGFSCELDINFKLELYIRSGLAATKSLMLINEPAQIDADFRGQVKAIIKNIGFDPVIIHHKDRICQGAIVPVHREPLLLVDTLSETKRGEGGFGHTGK